MKNALLFLLIAGTVCSCSKNAAGEAPRIPNIVFILIDDLRHDTFGHAGHSFIKTPHIDELAEGGLRFRNAFVTTSLCSPSRTLS